MSSRSLKNSSISYKSNAAILKMLLKKVAAVLGSRIFINGINTNSYYVLIMAHS